jgi:small-conductance mechanosensitive channel
MKTLSLKISASWKLLTFRIFTILFLLVISSHNAFCVNDTSNVFAKPTVSAVELDGKILFYVRGMTSFTSEERSKVVSERIKNIAANNAISPDSLKIIGAEDHEQIFAGNELIIRIFDADAEIEGVPRQLLAEAIKQSISKAVVSYRYERSTGMFIKNIIYAAIATVVLILIFYLLQYFSLRLDKLLESKIKSRLEGLEVQSHRLIQAKQLWSAFGGIVKLVKIFLVILLVIFYLEFVLELFPLTKPIAGKLFSLLIEPIGILGSSLLSALPNIAFLVVFIIVIRYLLKIIKIFFTGIAQGSIVIKNFDADWTWPTYKILRFLLIAFSIVIAYPYIPGSDSDAFKGVSVLLGIMFSLGSSSFISNIIAGYSLTYRRAFKLGDRIRVDDMMGDVIDIKPFVTRLRSLKNEEVIIPNSNLINSNVINYSSLSRQNGLILHTIVGIGYETPWRLVEEMLKTAADRTNGLLKDPSPYVLQKTLGDFAISYEINAYCNEPTRMMPIYTELHRNILDVFNENHVQIMTPAYEGDPAEPKVVPKAKWFTSLMSGNKAEQK